MSKQLTWHIAADETATHTVTYTLHRFSGRMKVTINGEEYVLSAGFLSLKAARRETFRLVGSDGEAEQAILSVDKKGRATLLFRAKTVDPEPTSA